MSILPTHKEGVIYLEHCAVRSSDDRLAYIRKKDAIEQHFSVPSKNVAALLLGPGTSLSQQAARLCAEGQILVGFCAGGATPVYLASLNEYREPRYSRAWITGWQDEQWRLKTAIAFQHKRAELIKTHWPKNMFSDGRLVVALKSFQESLPDCSSAQDILLIEAALSKSLYSIAAGSTDFARRPRAGDGSVNDYLDASNYLAYGLAASCLWVLGIPYSYPVVHGKTRRGALVFDVADLVKDGLVMPTVFTAWAGGLSESDYRRAVVANLHEARALKTMFDQVLLACE